ncbi:MAG: potassium channel protein [Phycisphaerae bacterium]|nr:potassium channel protein [Phycisphaerae bacterium]
MPAQKKLLIAMLALVAVFLIGAGGYCFIEEDVSFGQAAYMTIITLSTVGYQHVWPLSPAGMVWTSLIIIFGILAVMVVFTHLTAMIVGGELRGVLGRRTLQNNIAKLSGHYIVCGYGRMGQLISDNLRRGGEKIVVVDKDDKQTVLAEEAGVAYVLGDATDEDVLRTAGIERASGLVSALGGDANNVFVTLTAAGMRREMPIIARAEYLDSEPKLKRAGATHVVCPDAIGALRMANLMARPAVVHLVDITSGGSEWEIDEVLVPPDSRLVGQSLRDLGLRKQVNATVVAIKDADGKTKMNPGADHVVNAGDVLVVIGPMGIASVLLRSKDG